jgi:hypothetical protein
LKHLEARHSLDAGEFQWLFETDIMAETQVREVPWAQ